MLKRLKKLFFKFIFGGLNEYIEDRLNSRFDAHIQNVHDLKSDYLKRYLEVRMNNVSLSISEFTNRFNSIDYRLRDIEQSVSELTKENIGD